MTIPGDSNYAAELGQTVGLLARLVEVSLALNSTLDPDELLQPIIDERAGKRCSVGNPGYRRGDPSWRAKKIYSRNSIR